ncbi:MAG TPA: DUF6573 family protein [Mycobacterium sp.]
MPTPHPDGRAAVPYTRADAIADALLFEVPPILSRQFRFTYPVAVTAVAWFDAVAWDVQAEASKSRPTHQCEAGRITDLLWAARHAVDADRTGSHEIEFTVFRVPPTGSQTRALRLTLVLHLHRGDHGETVATIAHPSPPHVGHFHLYEDPATVWPAVGIDRDHTTGYRFPVVTADTLDEFLGHIVDVFCVRGIEVMTGLDGFVHVAERDGRVRTLRPDDHGRYHLRSLGWPLICHDIGS